MKKKSKIYPKNAQPKAALQAEHAANETAEQFIERHGFSVNEYFKGPGGDAVASALADIIKSIEEDPRNKK